MCAWANLTISCKSGDKLAAVVCALLAGGRQHNPSHDNGDNGAKDASTVFNDPIYFHIFFFIDYPSCG